MSKASRDPKTGRFIGVSHKVSKPQHVLSAGKSGWVVKKKERKRQVDTLIPKKRPYLGGKISKKKRGRNIYS